MGDTAGTSALDQSVIVVLSCLRNLPTTPTMAASDVETVTPQSGKSPNSQQKATSPQKDATTVKKEAINHLVAGKRHMLVQDIAAAVASLAQACEMMSAQFGETAVECADAYFHYGKALLEMARLESGVLGNALDGVPDGEDSDSSQCEDPSKLTEDEKEEVGVKVLEALDENFKTHEEKIALLTNGHTKVTNGHSKKDESTEGEEEDEESQEEGEESQDDEEMKEGEAREGEAETKNGEAESKTEDKDKMETESVGDDEKTKDEKEAGDKEEQQAEDEEDPSNLQLAWEMLELAKVIFTKQADETKDDQADVEKKLCETFLALGEVSLENENYPQAVDDLTSCLKKQPEKLPADSRSIAETHYQLGVAQGFHLHFEEAVKSLNDAITVLTTRIDNLKKRLSLRTRLELMTLST